MRARRLLAAGCALAACALGCAAGGRWAESRVPYAPDRQSYAAFRAAQAGRLELLEPNYLPFMLQRFSDPAGGDDWLLFCRWPDAAMPLSVHVPTPAIPEGLQDEFDPRDPALYVRAVEAALALWEGELEGLVAFRRAESPAEAALEIALVAERAAEGPDERLALGAVRLGGACEPRGWREPGRQASLAWRVPPLRIYLADRFGLLTPDQVGWIALHEIGHALGMRGHSPLPADLMYEQVRDRVAVPGLSAEDANSFVDLYLLPSGTVYGRVPPGGEGERPAPQPPVGPPELALAPHVDPRLGFSVRAPRGWLRVDTARGMVAVDGVTWDYVASFQVIVERYATLEEYLGRYGEAYLSHGAVERVEPLVVRGRRALHARIRTREGGMTEELTFIESGDGRVFALIADCPSELAEAYRPWFRAALSSLEIWGL